MLGDLARELERVAGVVGEPDHLVALIVVAEDDEAIAERARAPRRCALHLLVRQAEITLGQRLPLVQALLLDLVENRQKGARAMVDRRLVAAPACELVKLFAISGREKTKRTFGRNSPPVARLV